MGQHKKYGIMTFITAAVISLPALWQKIIFLNAKKYMPANENTMLKFHWKHGTTAYHCKGNGKPMLLLHNTQIGASHKEWDKIYDALTKKFKVYAVDLPGFGSSEKPKITYTAYQYTLFINAFIEQVIQEPVNIIASSASADFAVMACKFSPDNFKKLILISPTGINCKPASNADARMHRLLQSPIAGTQLYLKKASKKAITHMLRHESFFAQEMVTNDLINIYYFAAHNAGESARFTYASAATQFLNTEITEAFQTMKKPFLVAWGKDNRSNSIKNLYLLQNLRPNGQYATFENTRMLPHYESSTVFLEAINRFL